MDFHFNYMPFSFMHSVCTARLCSISIKMEAVIRSKNLISTKVVAGLIGHPLYSHENGAEEWVGGCLQIAGCLEIVP